MPQLVLNQTYNAKSDNGEEALDQESHKQFKQNRRNLINSPRAQCSFFPVSAGTLARGCDIQKQLSHGELCQRVPIAHQSCYQRYKRYLQQRVLFYQLDPSERLSPIFRGFDKERSQCTANDAHKYEASKLEILPVDQVSHFKQHDLVCTVRVEKFERQRGDDTAEEGSEQRFCREKV